MTYVFFCLFCMTLYFHEIFSGMWIFTIFSLYMWWFTWEHNTQIAMAEKGRIEKEKEQARILDPSLREIEREEAAKRDRRQYFLWNCFGWTVLVGLAFVSAGCCFVFFFLGGLFFNWGEFLYRPIKDFF